MQVPDVLLKSLNEFVTLRKSALRKRYLYYFVSKIAGFTSITIGLLIMMDGIPVSVRILTAIMASLTTFVEIFTPQKASAYQGILQRKIEKGIRMIEIKIAEFKEYFRDIEANAVVDIPPQFTTTELFAFINHFYQEIDDIHLSHLTEGSYERICRASSST
jgi:hypothetical protein